MVNPDIMSKKNLLKIACAHPELPVEGEHDRSLTLSDARSFWSICLLMRRYSTCTSVQREEMLNPSDRYILSSRNILISHLALNLLSDNPLNLPRIKHVPMPIIHPYTTPKLTKNTLPD
ncbi:MAG TPA: hypothetical protein VJ044_02685 [Candidatus Hodarchaeales archaeon]|nr:hypothetical protein [Candidatus Hodarchaeales archaeon]